MNASRLLIAVFGAALLFGCKKSPKPPKMLDTFEAPLARELASGASPNAMDRRGMPPLVEAAKTARLDLARALVSAGADLEATDENGWTALHHAANFGDELIVTYLAASGANVDAKATWGGVRPLQLAARRGCVVCLRVLTEHGAKVDATDDFGRQPIHFAALEDRHFDAISFRWLLDHGANEQARDARGMTVAHHAASESALAVLDLLHTRNFDFSQTDRVGYTAADTAVWLRSDPAIRWFLRHAVTPKRLPRLDPLEDAVRRDDANALQFLLSLETLDAQSSQQLEELADLQSAKNTLRILQLYRPVFR